MAHRPAAHLVRQIEQRGLARNLGARLGGHQAAGRGGRNGRLLITRTLAQEAARPDRDDLGQIGGRTGNGLRGHRVHTLIRSRFGAGGGGSSARRRALSRFAGHAALSGFGPRFGHARRGRGSGLLRGSGRLLLVVGLHRRRARLQAKAVRLADHRIAADPAELGCDLARGGAAFPHLLERCDALVRPAHMYYLFLCPARAVKR